MMVGQRILGAAACGDSASMDPGVASSGFVWCCWRPSAAPSPMRGEASGVCVLRVSDTNTVIWLRPRASGREKMRSCHGMQRSLTTSRNVFRNARPRFAHALVSAWVRISHDACRAIDLCGASDTATLRRTCRPAWRRKPTHASLHVAVSYHSLAKSSWTVVMVSRHALEERQCRWRTQ